MRYKLIPVALPGMVYKNLIVVTDPDRFWTVKREETR